MNKKTLKIAGLALGLSMAVAGIGAAVSASLKAPLQADAAATGDTKFALISSTSDLEVGKSYIITNGASGSMKAISTEANDNNRRIANATPNTEGKIVRGSSIMSFTLGGSEDAWTFKTENYAGTAGYLNATSTTSKNYLKVVADLDDYANFSIAFDGSAAVITCTGKTSRNVMRFNSNLFACYNEGGQDPVYLWKEVAAEVITAKLESITATSTQTQVFQGDALDESKITVMGHYDDSVDRELSTGWTVSCDTSVIANDVVATVTYTDAETNEFTDTFTVNVVEKPVYSLVTDIKQLTVGSKVLIAGQKDTKTYVAKTYNSSVSANNVRMVEATLDDGKVVKTDEMSDMTIGADANGYTLQDESGNYLYAAGTKTSGENYLKGKDTLDSACYWYISIDAGAVSIVSLVNEFVPHMQFNTSSTIVACYNTASQTAVKLYVKNPTPTTADQLDTFEKLYMRKTEVDHADAETHKVSTNECIAYFDKAKAALDGDWADIAEAFHASDLWARYVSWAAAKGVVVTYDSGIVYNAANVSLGVKNENNSALIVVITLAAGALATAGLFVFHKRKQN